jgi:hypothetical protein
MDAPARFSRTALPGGEPTFRRARDVLQHVFVGAFGRGNSYLTTALCQTLPIHHTTVVDSDVFEEHHQNGHRALSRPGASKAAAAVPLLSPYGVAVTPIRARLEQPGVVDRIRTADLVLLWPDEQGLSARRLTALAAAAFAVPVLALGTRVDADGAGQADVFFSLPFYGACLLCMAALPHAWDPRPERAGSLLSVNLLAVSLGLQLVQDWLAGELSVSTWVQAVLPPGEAPSVTGREYAVNPNCPVCRWGGGEGAWRRWITLSA